VTAPGILEALGVGFLRNSRFEAEENKLRSDLCIDMARAGRISPQSLTTILSDGHLEVSTGVYTDEDASPGTWNDESFIASVIDYAPDHLALLPGGRGACSWADGCGVRANADEGGKETDMKGSGGTTGRLRTILNNVAEALGLKVQEMSLDDRRTAIRNAVYALDNTSWSHYIVEVYDSWLVYEANAKSSNDPSAVMPSPSTRLYKRSYTIDAQTGAATLSDDAQEVREETSYVPVNGQPGTAAGSPAANEAAGDDQAKKEAETMKKNELIEKLIGCPCTRFTANDQAFLETLNEEQLEKLQPPDGVGVLPTEPPAPTQNQTPAPADPPAEPPKQNADPKPKPEGIQITADQFRTLQRAEARDKAEKDQLVTKLLANQHNPFTKDQLEAKELEELKALAQLGHVEVDYGPQGGPPATNADPNAAPPMPKVFEYPAKK
jgi:hypothetical protein